MSDDPTTSPTPAAPVRADILDALSRADVFTVLPASTVRGLAAASEIRPLRRDEHLWSRGDPCERMAVVVRGRLRCGIDGDGGRHWVRKIIRAGQEAGLASVVGGLPCSGSAVALENSRVVLVPRDAVRELLEHEPAFALHTARILAREVAQSLEFCANLTCKSPMERLAGFLTDRADEHGVVELDDTQGELAAQLGTVREVVGRAFSRLERQGILERNGRTVRLLRAAEIERIASR